MTIARLYTDRVDRLHFKDIFDKFQALVVKLAGKLIRFKTLTPGGTLTCLNADMELT
jgi:hypothetical protein